MYQTCRRSVLPAILFVIVAVAPHATAAVVHLAGPTGAQVRIDGEPIGMLPLAPFEMRAGAYEVTASAAGYEDLGQTLLVPEGDGAVHVHLRLLRMRRSRAVTGSLLYAGLGQWYSGARLRGWVYFTGETLGLATALVGEVARANKEDEYTNAIRSYDAAVAPSEVGYWKRVSQTTHQDLQDMEDLRDLGLMVAAGAWAVSLLDAALLFPAVELGPGTDPVDPTGRGGVHAAVTIGF